MSTEEIGTAPVRLLIVEDHRSYRVGLTMDLEPFKDQVSIVDSVANAADALKSVVELEPDVVLLDLLLPERSAALSEPQLEHGLNLIEKIKARKPESRILILTTLKENPYVIWVARRSGADGYVAKDEDRTGAELITLIKEVLRPDGMRSYSPVIQGQLNKMSKLTARELEILEFLAEGWSNPEVANELSTTKDPLTEKTVRNHVRSIFTKLDVESRQDLRIKHGRPE